MVDVWVVLDSVISVLPAKLSTVSHYFSQPAAMAFISEKNNEFWQLLNITWNMSLVEKCITDVNWIFLTLAVLRTSEGKLGDVMCLPVNKGGMLPGRWVSVYCFVLSWVVMLCLFSPGVTPFFRALVDATLSILAANIVTSFVYSHNAFSCTALSPSSCTNLYKIWNVGAGRWRGMRCFDDAGKGFGYKHTQIEQGWKMCRCSDCHRRNPL